MTTWAAPQPDAFLKRPFWLRSLSEREANMSDRTTTSSLGILIAGITRLVSRDGLAETQLLDEGEELLSNLIAHDNWLPEAYSVPHPQYYSQYLLYCDPLDRFSVVSFVWGPGQSTPIHNHTVWGLVGVLRGAEISERFDQGAPMKRVSVDRLERGMIDRVSPSVGDIHKVSNAFEDQPSISIHIYGANIGTVARNVFDASTGAMKSFVSGYTNVDLPNPWAGVNLSS
jgi:predicted metal-dependent enzyme (double-stranded beta helix superfamily)